MKLNHLDLLVRDVPATVAYFTRYFGLTVRTKPEAPSLAVLTDGHGFVLVLQQFDEPSYPGHFHLGFLVDDPETVRSLQARARDDGADVSDVIENNRGVMFYVQAPGDVTVEVSCRRVA